MYHHSEVPYNVAASEAAKAGRIKMEEIIHRGLASAKAVADQVEKQVPQDRIVKSGALMVLPSSLIGGDCFSLSLPDVKPQRLHRHALGQLCELAAVPGRYIADLAGRGAWGRELAADNLNRVLRNSEQKRHLLRSVTVGDSLAEVRGIVSDRFRRLDARPMLDAFMGACQKIGAVPIEGYALDTKVKMRAVLPMVFEPLPNEVMIWGIEWGNSDFGDGGHTLSLWNMRTWCTNLAVCNQVLRQVHIGKRLDDNIQYSDRTYQLDTQANVSALQDVIQVTLGPERVNAYQQIIRDAAEMEVGKDNVGQILKKKLGKEEVARVQAAFDSPDVVNLPEGNTMYRLSNAVSWFAQSTDITPNRKLELQRIAGELLPAVKMEAVEV
jgi:hypothetical protein